MVIVDECHHGASHIFENVLRQINSKYVYGVSANDKRIDRLEKKVYMQLGPIRHQYTSRERIKTNYRSLCLSTIHKNNGVR